MVKEGKLIKRGGKNDIRIGKISGYRGKSELKRGKRGKMGKTMERRES